MAHFLIYKRPVEVTSYQFDFTGLFSGTTDTALDTGKSVIVVTDSSGVDRTSYFLQKTTFSGFIMTGILANGLNGEDYRVDFNGVGNVTGQVYNRILEVRSRTVISGNL